MQCFFNPMLLHIHAKNVTTCALKSQPNIQMLCEQNRLKEALHLLNTMACPADSFTYASLLKGCTKKKALAEGKLVLAHMKERGFIPNKFLLNSIINMYAKCQTLTDARRVFDQMPERDVFSWTSMISACVCTGNPAEALALFRQMQRAGFEPDQFTFGTVLPACKSLADVEDVHGDIIRSGRKPDVFVGSALVDMYAKCGSIENARTMFDKMPERDVVSWNNIIAAYGREGYAYEALDMFQQMKRAGIQPNEFSFATVLPACTKSAALEQGIEVHEEVKRFGFQTNAFVASALVDMYAKCGSIGNARNVFDDMRQQDVVSWTAMVVGYAQNGNVDEAVDLFEKMPEPNIISWNAMIAGYTCNGLVKDALELFRKIPQRNVVSWNTMIAGYAQNGHADEALELFQKMRLEGMNPDSQTFGSILPACASLVAVEKGMEIHGEIVRSGLQSDVFVGSALVDMYAKCGSLKKALDVFHKMPHKNTVSWTAMIAGYAQTGYNAEALELFQQMKLAGVNPDSSTFASVIPACTSLAALEQGMQIHVEIITRRFQSDAFVGSALVDMYAKCGIIEMARTVFDNMTKPNAVPWTSIIAGYSQNGNSMEALELFQQMKLASVKPDANTFASVLSACAGLAALEQGMEIHEETIRRGLQSNVFVVSALVDMYAKCGSIQKARHLFNKMPKRNIVSWTAMIAGYAMHGYGKEAVKLFEQMQHCGVSPNHVTLVCVLSACCHAGLVDEGQQYFHYMSQNYNIKPTMEHYGCMVDLLARSGCLDVAQDFINKMPIKPDVTVWGCLLGACRTHNNVELAEYVAERILELNPEDAAPYVLLSNIYAASGKWDGLGKVRKMMNDRMVKKTPGCSWIEINKQVHSFPLSLLERVPWSHTQAHQV